MNADMLTPREKAICSAIGSALGLLACAAVVAIAYALWPG